MNGVYYGDYLQLEKILTSQDLESEKHNAKAHDEMLFIVVHQAFELWFKQILWEIDDMITIMTQDYVPEAQVGKALERIQRVNTIIDMFPKQFSILETMSPRGFMEFRDFLYPASGFQSLQFRVAEIRCGLTDSQRHNIDSHGYASRLSQKDQEVILKAKSLPSLFTALEQWLEKLPFMEMDGYSFWTTYRTTVKEIFDHDRKELHAVDTLTVEEIARQEKQIEALEYSFNALFDESVYNDLQAQGVRRLSQKATLAALFISVYSDFPLLQTPYRLLTAIMELDNLLSVFRFRHTMMVSRMIGQRVGTGGSSGFDYLLKTVTQNRIFTDLTSLSSYLLPSASVPKLPSAIAHKLQFVAES